MGDRSVLFTFPSCAEEAKILGKMLKIIWRCEQFTVLNHAVSFSFMHRVCGLWTVTVLVSPPVLDIVVESVATARKGAKRGGMIVLQRLWGPVGWSSNMYVVEGRGR